LVEECQQTNTVIVTVRNSFDKDILESSFYKNKINEFWPDAKLLENYQSKYVSTHGECLAYFEVPKIEHLTFYTEWTPRQVKDAILLWCDIHKYCYENKVWISAHLWNFVYYKGRPLYIDVRDFMPNSSIYNSKQHIKDISRVFNGIIDYHQPVYSDIWFKNSSYIYKSILSIPNNISINEGIEKMKKIIYNAQLKEPSVGTWSNYMDDIIRVLKNAKTINDCYNDILNFTGGKDPNTGKEYTNYKSLSVINTVRKYNPRTVVEIGCNVGMYCFAISLHCDVIGIDYDTKAINTAVKLNNKFNTSCNFFNLDILNEHSAQRISPNGLSLYYEQYKLGDKHLFKLPNERLKSEFLIAPDVIHHLYTQCKSLEKIIKIFSNYASKYMLIEYIPGYGFSLDDLILELSKKNWEKKKYFTFESRKSFVYFCTKIII